MSHIEHCKSLTLDLPPSCIEFWPSNPQYAVAGTYNLEKPSAEHEEKDSDEDVKVTEDNKSQSRNGSLILLHVEDNNV